MKVRELEEFLQKVLQMVSKIEDKEEETGFLIEHMGLFSPDSFPVCNEVSLTLESIDKDSEDKDIDLKYKGTISHQFKSQFDLDLIVKELQQAQEQKDKIK